MPKRVIEKQDTLSNNKKRTAPLRQLKNKFEAINTFYAFCNANSSTFAVTLNSLQRVVPDLTCQDLAAINVILPNFVKFNYVSAEILEIEFGYPVSKKGSKPVAVKRLIDQQNNLFNKAIPTFLKLCKQKKVDPDDHILYELEKHMPLPNIFDDDDVDDNQVVEEVVQPQKTITQVIEGLKQTSFYGGQLESIENIKSFDSKSPIYGELELSQEIQTALQERGIDRLYIHQAEAIQGLFDQQHVIVSTSTARYYIPLFFLCCGHK